MKSIAWVVVSVLCGVLVAQTQAAEPGSITVDGATPGPKINPMFYGLMTEEINHAYDGGLYAELIQNRIFQDNQNPVCWSAVGDGSIAIDEKDPVNTVALTRSLRLNINTPGKVGIANTGFWGIPVWPNTKYHASFYAKGADGGALTASIESNDGNTTFATATTPAITGEWKKYELDLSTADVATSTGNRFVITSAGKGPIYFSLVSLFPPTYHDRPNGFRIDIMQKLADMHPSFLRFPGGNFLEGDTIPTRFDWKKTIGPLENRPGHQGCWSYHVSDGLGLLEFLDWCEDLKMEPLLAVYDGYSLKQQHVEPGPDMEPFVKEALEEIEYCTGDTTTTWGKRRADDGHPAPFVIHYIEIGNEDWFDRSNTYDGRFTQMFKAIKEKYPKLQCIATARKVKSVKPDLYDDHDYPHPDDMLRKVHRYDNYSADEPRVFFGEWATQDGRPTPTMRAALCDAAWLCGLQTDSDKVLLNCYAPLFVNVNPKAWQWPTNLIGYDAATSFGSPSYYAQAMFAKAWGDTNLPMKLEAQKVDLPPTPGPTGNVGVGTWHTTAEFKDLKVTEGDKTLYTSDFATGTRGWRMNQGEWEAGDGVLKQTDAAAEDSITTGDRKWGDYTLSLKARKTGGDEGFLILFHNKDKTHFGWVNIGGWGNTQTAIEIADGGRQATVGEPAQFTVETNKWYDIRIELKGLDVKTYVDDKLIVQATATPGQPAAPLFAAASKVESTGEVILKVVNTVNVPQQLKIDLTNVGNLAKEATYEQLTGEADVQNTVAEPTRIAPTTGKIDDAGTSFTHEFPGNSVTVIRLSPEK